VDHLTRSSPEPGPRRIVVAMSGGVDSSVAALLLREQGHDVIGVTLRLQKCHESGPTRSCCSADGIARARAVADRLAIRHYVVSCVREFDERVLRPAWNEYAAGRTPSPCFLCNERIKFGFLRNWARDAGASAVATGHYARVQRGADGAVSLLRAPDAAKDQSYFLAGLTRDQLAAALFPVGGMSKSDVRALARSAGLPCADAGESQDACLVAPGMTFAETLRLRFGAAEAPGPIVDRDGTTLGRHAGIHLYTVGQRTGLGIATGRPHWVAAIRREDAAVVVTDDERDLERSRIMAGGMSWLDEPPEGRSLRCEVQVRHGSPAVRARTEIAPGNETLIVTDRPVRAPAPGQAAVLYDGESVLGRGWIRQAA